MDGVNWRDKIVSFLRQYRYVILVIAIGLVLMSIPGRQEDTKTGPDPDQVQTSRDIQSELEQILSQIQGVGKVRVLLTESAGEMTLYERSEDSTRGEVSDSTRTEPIILTDENRAQQGLIQQVIPPAYQGAVIVCQGGNQPTVQLAVVEAVSDVTGLTADKITVLKMK